MRKFLTKTGLHASCLSLLAHKWSSGIFPAAYITRPDAGMSLACSLSPALSLVFPFLLSRFSQILQNESLILLSILQTYFCKVTTTYLRFLVFITYLGFCLFQVLRHLAEPWRETPTEMMTNKWSKSRQRSKRFVENYRSIRKWRISLGADTMRSGNSAH